MATGERRVVVAVLAFGTIGDVLPVAVVTAALAKARPHYSVTFITHSAHEFLEAPLTSDGVSFYSISTPPAVPLSSTIDLSYFDQRHRDECLKTMDQVMAEDGLDSVIAINFFALEGWHLSELFRAKIVVIAPYVVPYSAPTSFERCFQANHPLLYKRLHHALPGEVHWNDVEHWMWPLFMDRWQSWRLELGLSACPLTDPVTGLPLHNWPEAVPLLYGFSHQIVECPGYWPPSIRVCGFWLQPDEWNYRQVHNLPQLGLENEGPGLRQKLPDMLAEFMIKARSTGSEILFISLSSIGSMGLLHNPRRMLEVLKAALALTNIHAVLFTADHPPLNAAVREALGSDANLKDIGEQSLHEGSVLYNGHLFCYSGYVPYTLLFPMCSMVLHHGGSGTTAACLHAGIPQIVCPFLHDQFYWAERLAWIGVAPQPLKPQNLMPDDTDHQFSESVNTIVSAISEASSKELRVRAVSFGNVIRSEDGTSVAVKTILSELSLEI